MITKFQQPNMVTYPTLNAVNASLWLVHGLTYPEGALMTGAAYGAYKRLAEPAELKSHTAVLVPELGPEHLKYDFVGSIEVAFDFKFKD